MTNRVISGTRLREYPRTMIFGIVLLFLGLQESLGIREAVHYDLYDSFQWLKHSSWLGVIGSTYGSVYATIEAIHLISMAVLGGCIFVTDMHLLGLLLKNASTEQLVRSNLKCIKLTLIIAIATGIFCACGVADKIYEKPVFWVKMFALLTGCCFQFLIKQPLLDNYSANKIDKLTLRLTALSSLLVWFTVAASGRWIGFS